MQKKLSAVVLIFLSYASFSQLPASLSVVYDPVRLSVSLEWSMVTIAKRTAYIILKSTDGVNWMELVKDKLLRNYTKEDLYTYEDKHITTPKNLYRLRIMDVENNTVALSNIVSVSQLLNNKPIITTETRKKNNTSIDATEPDEKKWVIYPNPVHDILTLSFNGLHPLQGAINITIQDMSGKIVTRYRGASTNKVIQVPVDYLARGTYLLQLIVSNEVIVNQRFIKQ